MRLDTVALQGGWNCRRSCDTALGNIQADPFGLTHSPRLIPQDLIGLEGAVADLRHELFPHFALFAAKFL